MTQAQHLAHAYLDVARTNHYMVGVVFDHTDDLLDDAEQILIGMESLHADPPQLQLALDLIEHERARRLRR